MTHPDDIDHEALKLAAPAPGSDDAAPAPTQEDGDLDDLCERWVEWCRTRRFYAPASNVPSILGQLSGRRRPPRVGGVDALVSPELAAFHVAYLSQPDKLDKKVFQLYYVHRVKPIKSAAAALKISDRQFYRLLGEFRRRVRTSAQAVQAGNEAAYQALPHSPENSGES